MFWRSEGDYSCTVAENIIPGKEKGDNKQKHIEEASKGIEGII